MKTIQKTIPQMCIERFAENNGLEMEIHERKKPIGDPSRYYAHFKNCEEKDGGCLRGSFGNGATPEEAIKDYANEINLKTIVIDAFSPNRREIEVPRIVLSPAHPGKGEE